MKEGEKKRIINERQREVKIQERVEKAKERKTREREIKPERKLWWSEWRGEWGMGIDGSKLF